MDDKKITTPSATAAPASSARPHKAGDDGTLAGGTRRFSAKRKLTAVQRLMPLAFQGNEAWGDEVSAHWRRVEGGVAAELDDITPSAEILTAAAAPDLARRLLTE